MGASFLLICAVGIFIILTSVILLSASLRVVPENKRLSIYRLGRFIGEKGPGLVLVIPFVDRGVMKELGEASESPSRKLVGTVGESRTTVFTDGKVFLGGEEWEATSQQPISAGQRVRVVRMVLEVEPE